MGFRVYRDLGSGFWFLVAGFRLRVEGFEVRVFIFGLRSTVEGVGEGSVERGLDQSDAYGNTLPKCRNSIDAGLRSSTLTVQGVGEGRV
jgi:hypothetical protein